MLFKWMMLLGPWFDRDDGGGGVSPTHVDGVPVEDPFGARNHSGESEGDEAVAEETADAGDVSPDEKESGEADEGAESPDDEEEGVEDETVDTGEPVGEVDEEGWPKGTFGETDQRPASDRRIVPHDAAPARDRRSEGGRDAGSMTEQEWEQLTPGERLMYRQMQTMEQRLEERFGAISERDEAYRRQQQVDADNQEASRISDHLLRRNSLLSKKGNEDIAAMVLQDVQAAWNFDPRIKLSELPQLIRAKTQRYMKILRSREPSDRSRRANAAADRHRHARRDTSAPVSGGGGGAPRRAAESSGNGKRESLSKTIDKALTRVGVS